MKKKTAMRLVGLAAAWVAGVFLVQTALAAGASARVTRLVGKVEVQVGEGAYQPAAKGDRIEVGARIRTGARTKVEIRLADNSVIRLGSNSSLHLQQALFSGTDKKVTAQLLGGKAYAVVDKLTGGDSKFEVKTATAVAGVRGTAFRIDAKQDKSTVVRVYAGAVAVSNAPIYAKPGKTEASGKFQMPGQGVKPGGPGRVEVAGPQEVTKKQWEEIVAKAMQEIKVSATGELSPATAFSAAAELQNDEEGWVAWNKEMDKQLP